MICNPCKMALHDVCLFPDCPCQHREPEEAPKPQTITIDLPIPSAEEFGEM